MNSPCYCTLHLWMFLFFQCAICHTNMHTFFFFFFTNQQRLQDKGQYMLTDRVKTFFFCGRTEMKSWHRVKTVDLGEWRVAVKSAMWLNLTQESFLLPEPAVQATLMERDVIHSWSSLQGNWLNVIRTLKILTDGWTTSLLTFDIYTCFQEQLFFIHPWLLIDVLWALRIRY